MLKRQNRGWHQNGALLAVRRAFERRAQCDFGFAEAHIPAKQTIHWVRFFHIALDFVNRAQLVGGFVIREAALKVALHIHVRRKRIARGVLAFGIEGDKLVCHILDRRAHARTGFFPFLAADAV